MRLTHLGLRTHRAHPSSRALLAPREAALRVLYALTASPRSIPPRRWTTLLSRQSEARCAFTESAEPISIVNDHLASAGGSLS